MRSLPKGRKVKRKTRSKVVMRIVASRTQGFWLVYDGSEMRVSKESAQIYFKKLRVVKKYYSSELEGKVYHMAKKWA